MHSGRPVDTVEQAERGAGVRADSRVDGLVERGLCNGRAADMEGDPGSIS